MSESSAIGAAPEQAAAPANPYRTALIVIAAVGILLGVIILVLGAANAASYAPNSFTHTDNGIVEVLVGWAIASVGIVALVVFLGAQMMLWRAPTDNEPPV